MTDILVEHDGPVATVVFNRPKVRNAISLAMWAELARVTEGLAKDDSVRAIVYGADAVGRLVALVGPAYAKDILYSARTVGDREALAMGLIQRLLPPDELEAHAYDYLRKVADNAPLSVRGAKLTIESYLLGLTEERRAKLKELALEAFESEDYKEGTRAFLEKRAPKFQGR